MENIQPKLLAIDDAPENLSLLGEALSEEFDFEIATSGARGLQLARTGKPDLILLDVMMPEMNGFEVCAQLRQDPATAAIPVIFITALGDTESENKGLQLGAVDYLTKPINVPIARLRIQNQVQRSRLLKEVSLHRDRLEELVASRTTDLVAARDEALRLATVKSQFLADMNHQIRTPLHGVLAFADLGFRNEQSSEKAREFFGKIGEAAKQLQRVANDIGIFAMFESNKLNLERVSVEPRRIIDETVRAFERQRMEKDLHLAIRVTPEVPEFVYGDPVRVRQILGALLSNAIKFTDSGGVSIEVDYDGRRLSITVCDTGIGLSEEQIARFFQHDGQADTSLTRNYAVSGFGLLIAKRIIDAMSGELRIEGKLGQGSRFEVFLPLAVQTVAP